MKLVAAFRMLPTPDQAASLKMTLECCNKAATWVGKVGFENQIFRQFNLQKITYYDIRNRFGLTAQAAIRTIAKVADAFAINRKRAPIFRATGAQPYDNRIIRFTKDQQAVNLWTVDGRITVRVAIGEHQKKLIAYRKGEIDLCLVRGKWMLAATCEIPETEEFTASDWLGVDFGIVSLAVDSDGTIHTGNDVEMVRRRLANRRRGLQKRGTKAAKRRLRKLAGKEKRFRKHVNHCISKVIVTTAERTGRGVALENLKGIHNRVTVRRSQRSRLCSWSFRQLRSFVTYKAKRYGVPVTAADPRNTSVTCSCCGLIDKRNRPNQATFSCISCGHSEAADLNAARNIRAKAAVVPPEVLTAQFCGMEKSPIRDRTTHRATRL